MSSFYFWRIYGNKKLTRDNLNDVIDLIYTMSILFHVDSMINKGQKGKKLFKLFFEESFDDMEMFGYFKDSKLVGVVGLEDNNYIPILYVLKEYQHLHIGTKLIEYVKNYVKNKTNFIEVCAHYKAIPFYEKNGFQSVNEIREKTVMMKYSIIKENIEIKKINSISFCTNFIWQFIRKDFLKFEDLVFTKYQEMIINDNITFYGYFINDNPVGIIGIKENYINYLYILEGYQHQHIGTNLLNFIINTYNNYDIITLDSNFESVDMYLKYGFEIDENKTNKYSIPMKYKRRTYGRKKS